MRIVFSKCGPGPATSAPPGNSLETNPGWDQKLWGWSPAVLTSPPGNSEAHSSLRTTNLEDEILPLLTIVKGVLQTLKVYPKRSFKIFVSRAGVRVQPLQKAEAGLHKRGPRPAT